MPNLTNVVLSDSAFWNYYNATINDSIPFISLSQLDIGALRPFFGYKECWSKKRVPDYTTDIVIDGTDGLLYCGAERELDLSRYPKLKTLTIEDLSYKNVNVTKFIGMNELESVEIGSSCFSETGQFYLKNCPKLKSLKIGAFSFGKYNVIEIENVDALEEIVMSGSNFWSAPSLELKSVLVPKES